MQSASNDAFLLILIAVCLAACFVRAFWQIEEARWRRKRRELVSEARRSPRSDQWSIGWSADGRQWCRYHANRCSVAGEQSWACAI